MTDKDILAFIIPKNIEDLPLAQSPSLVGNFVVEENGKAKRLPSDILNKILNTGISGDLDKVTAAEIPNTGYYKYDIFTEKTYTNVTPNITVESGELDNYVLYGVVMNGVAYKAKSKKPGDERTDIIWNNRKINLDFPKEPTEHGGWFFKIEKQVTAGDYYIYIFQDKNYATAYFNGNEIIPPLTGASDGKFVLKKITFSTDGILELLVIKNNKNVLLVKVEENVNLDVSENDTSIYLDTSYFEKYTIDNVNNMSANLSVNKPGVDLNLTSGGALNDDGTYFSSSDIAQSQLLPVTPGSNYTYYGALGNKFGIIGFTDSNLNGRIGILTADKLGIDGKEGNKGIPFTVPEGIKFIYYACWVSVTPVSSLIINDGSQQKKIGNPLMKGWDNDYFSNNPFKSPKYIGQEFANYKPILSLYGGLVADSVTGEHQLINSASSGSAATGGQAYRANVLSIRHKAPNGSSAIRFLRSSDGSEVGAVGFQNGNGSFFLDNSMFISASTPYNGNNGTGEGQLPFENPPQLIFGQEGTLDNSAGLEFNARMLCERNWNIGFYSPYDKNRPIIYMPAKTLNALFGTKTDNEREQVQVKGGVKADYFRSDIGNVPSSSTSIGKAGDIRFDANYMYVCISDNTWKRSSLNNW
ncbi:hypothetical protein CMT52_17945 [Elizabethkingia anophelis]|nr:hypothetical protein [Elizabethkingia anophelis]